MRMQVDGSRQHQFLTRVDLAFGPTDLSDGRNATALDPDVISQLLAASRRRTVLNDSLTGRESEVLALMAEGRSNAAIAEGTSR